MVPHERTSGRDRRTVGRSSRGSGLARIGRVGAPVTSRGRGRIALGGLVLALAGCHVPAPKPREVLATGFREPLQTFETFRTAFRGDLLELEYLCFSTGFHRRNGLSQLGYREFRDELLRRGAREVRTCVFLDKPSRRVAPIEPDFHVFRVDDVFVVGYGLDFAGRYRNLPFVGALRESVIQRSSGARGTGS